MAEATKNCPYCGEQILAVARKCRHCGEYLDAAARQEAHAPSKLDRLLAPVGRPISAIAAGYLGLISFVPLFGFVTGILAVVFGVVALRAINDNPSLCGKGRAWFGIIVGGALALLQGLGAVALVFELMTQAR